VEILCSIGIVGFIGTVVLWIIAIHNAITDDELNGIYDAEFEED